MSLLSLKIVQITTSPELNVILGQTHFIKSVEDIHEALVTSVPGIQFGLAFAEASGPCLIRTSGTKKELIELAAHNLQQIAAGHSFLIFLQGCYPINVLNTLKNVPEVCHIFCATANPLQVVVTESKQGRAILGVIDGNSPKGIETLENQTERKEFLRKIGYKF